MATDDVPEVAVVGETITIRKDFGEFLAALWQQSQNDYQWTVNQLMEFAQFRAAKAEVELDLVRGRIERLLHGDFMPTSAALVRALYPDPDVVKELVEERMVKGL